MAKYGFLPLAASPTFPAIITAFRRCSDTHGVSAHSLKSPCCHGGRLRDREVGYHVSTAKVSAGIDLPDVRTHPSGVVATCRAQRRHSSMRCAGCRAAVDTRGGWEPMCARPCTDLHVWLIRRASCHQRAGLEPRRRRIFAAVNARLMVWCCSLGYGDAHWLWQVINTQARCRKSQRAPGAARARRGLPRPCPCAQGFDSNRRLRAGISKCRRWRLPALGVGTRTRCVVPGGARGA